MTATHRIRRPMLRFARAPGATLAALALAAATGSALAETSASDGNGVDPVRTGSVAADAVNFSPALSGSWKGGGTVLTNTDQERPYTVTCEFDVDADATSFDLNGECGALFVTRGIATSLTRTGDTISGTYDASLRSGVAQLEGSEVDGAIALDVEWGDDVNGDREATMSIVREGEKLRIVTVDRDPATGEDVTTSDLLLERG